MITRRQFADSTPLLAASALSQSGCSAGPGSERYDVVAGRTWQTVSVTGLMGATPAHGLQGEAKIEPAGSAVRVMREPTRSQTTSWLTAVSLRQCTHGDREGAPLPSEKLGQLQRAGPSDRVRRLLLSDRPAMERTLDYVIQGHSVQLADAAFPAASGRGRPGLPARGEPEELR